MSRTVWGLHCVGNSGRGNTWFGFWESRHDAVGYLAKHADTHPRTTEHNGDRLAAYSAEWFDVKPIRWSEGDSLLIQKEPLHAEYNGRSVDGGAV